MPIAAVPAYLGNDFSHASPGLRFGMYLKIWEGTNWSKSKDKSLDSVKNLCDNDKKTMTCLLERQRQSFDTLDANTKFQLEARAIAPFTTGLGNEHPLENGFAFLNPYGLPYLPGSGVKGVLRQAARELASGEWGDGHGWSHAPHYSLKLDKATISLSVIDVLFGKESQDGDKEHVRGALSFWDVIPQIAGNSLAVEIMTPHQSHYYQQKAQLGSTTPHDSGQPNPISFITVPPSSQFTFHVVCDLRQLKRLTANRLDGAPDLLAEGDTHWKKLLEGAFEHAFTWLGFGAKTAVGYGAMARDREAEERAARQAALIRQQKEAKARREAELAKLSPLEREIAEFLDQRPDKNQSEISAVISAVDRGRWTGEKKIAVAKWLKDRMQATKGQWKETSQAKRPEKDKEYRNTLRVKRWLAGE